MKLVKIGEIHSPYEDWAPSQPPEKAAKNIEDFKIVLDKGYEDYLTSLEKFSYIYVLFYMDRLKSDVKSKVSPPWANGQNVGLFASRSPNRPSPVGLSVVRLLEVRGCELIISPIDALNGTPVLDIKPYFKGLDTKEDANYGWLEKDKNAEHVIQHLRAVPHDHHHHDHNHNDEHDHHHHDHHHEHGKNDHDKK